MPRGEWGAEAPKTLLASNRNNNGTSKQVPWPHFPTGLPQISTSHVKSGAGSASVVTNQ